MNNKISEFPALGLAVVALLAILNAPHSSVFAHGTAFTYQGRLNDGINPTSGIYDLRFAICDSTNSPGNLIAGPVTNAATAVTNGLFCVTLDFGSGMFTGDARWLDIAVRTNGAGSFAALAPRQALTATPFAIWAGATAEAQTADVAKNLAGPLPGDKLVGTYTGPLTLFNSTNVFYGDFYGDVYGDHFGDSFGDFYGDGYGITHLNASQLSFGTVPDAQLSTNVALLAASQIFTGTNTFSKALIATNAASQIAGTFTGSGAGLTQLNGAGLAAGSVSNAVLAAQSITADKLAAGQVVKSLNGLNDDVTLAAGANIALATNGNSLQISAGAVTAAWSLGGNSGTSPGTNFVGTTDNQPLELRVNGQRALRLEPNGSAPNVISGSPGNFVASGVVGATIAGGGMVGATNSASADFAVVSGGRWNTSSGFASTVSGGLGNNASGIYAIVGGGADNTASYGYATVAGGWMNTASWSFATVAGGESNSASSICSTVGGGENNSIQTNSSYSFLGGGWNNSIQTSASYSILGGGENNSIQLNAYSSFLGGGQFNTNGAPYSVVPGGSNNIAGGQFSFAAGQSAQATNTGAFVWADSTAAGFGSITNDTFNVRAQNGVRIQSNTGIHLDAANRPIIVRDWDPFNSNVPNGKANIGRWGLFMESANLVLGMANYNGAQVCIANYMPDGTRTNLMVVDNSGNVWAKSFNPTSDRNAKEHFAPVNAQNVLAKVSQLPISEWNFKSDTTVARHIGPMAQDFYAAFGVGTDDKHIATIDADGVALAAIQGLNQKLTEKDAEIQDLKARLERLEKLLSISSDRQ